MATTPTGVDPLFANFQLTELAQVKCDDIAKIFDVTLRSLENITPLGSREGAIVRTKLEEACTYAKKALQLLPSSQTPPAPEPLRQAVLAASIGAAVEAVLPVKVE